MKKIILVVLSLTALAACGPTELELEKLRQERERHELEMERSRHEAAAKQAERELVMQQQRLEAARIAHEAAEAEARAAELRASMPRPPGYNRFVPASEPQPAPATQVQPQQITIVQEEKSLGRAVIEGAADGVGEAVGKAAINAGFRLLFGD